MYIPIMTLNLFKKGFNTLTGVVMHSLFFKICLLCYSNAFLVLNLLVVLY